VVDAIRAELDGLDSGDTADVSRRAAASRADHVVADAAGARGRDRGAYRALSDRTGPQRVAVAVRSSATCERLSDASFAGEHDSYLWVRGDESVLESVRRLLASLFTDRAVSYRVP